MKSAVVVGAGIWGVSLAWKLAELGWRVTVVEQHHPGHVRQASAGETRLIRAAHGTDEWYTRMAWTARTGWREIERRAGEELFIEAGLVWFARDADGWERASARTLAEAGIPHEMWEPERAGRMFPDFSADGVEFALWEPGAGVVRARRSVQVLAGLARAAGVEFVRARALPYPKPGMRGVVLDGGEVLAADRVVWASGAWMPEVFPEIGKLEVTKQDTFHFGVPAAWTAPRVPAWVDYDLSAYGHGDIDGTGMKATSDAEGEPYDPENGSRAVSASSERMSRAYLARRFPSLAAAPVVFTQVCQYISTPDGNWIIAEVDDGVWLLGGDSGHGFKHAPALADYMAAILSDKEEPEARFGLHDRTWARGLRTSGQTE
ncbi:NAD(P)/FAD-dependent oxidoreductase [Sinosporangium siamense]|uniref:Sarcosine oxidase n=1 Tax=Sinosporangium siamense TaxID=1367973 RepID=A0A919RME2_9ACTN|nr:FAD-dependent oxidoreductase [Sinosporangium siamense]GII94826.1 sarcosine oxidase [Sinosporangium siamense]